MYNRALILKLLAAGLISGIIGRSIYILIFLQFVAVSGQISFLQHWLGGTLQTGSWLFWFGGGIGYVIIGMCIALLFPVFRKLIKIRPLFFKVLFYWISMWVLFRVLLTTLWMPGYYFELFKILAEGWLDPYFIRLRVLEFVLVLIVSASMGICFYLLIEAPFASMRKGLAGER